ncbi:PREDICTED: uncharacterized protein C1orf158 homolog isoform X1 [Mandrillus leucophaeus]|uniref:uncharacterized protein C1orf158 homolog isoform X1 n=1 Tax=Mandrillus leucophaeus TaxID=9568 RepID=UPI0005F412A6|nr:PREDICTED: uncharacterized protein C1orf158 homolog isoform X1 [Mandrillus leucophaeus]
MFLTAVNPQPLSTPGWQIETKYSTKVLTGNWVEERRKFTRDTDKTPQSISRKEYIPFPDHRPDQISRWYGKRKVEGLPYKHLITHHQEPPHRYLISTYDDHYNRHGYNPGLPPLRTWNGQKLLWLPEKSDFPLLGIFIIQGFPLNWSVKAHRPMQLYLPYAEGASQVTLAPGEQWMTQSGLSPIVPSGCLLCSPLDTG